MSKILLTGPAGSGKTHFLLDDFEHAVCSSRDPFGKDFFFVLPSAEHTERVISLVLQRGIPGFFNRRITTLTDLISDIFAAGEEGIATNVTRYLILKEILSGEPQGYFSQIQQTPGFLNLMLAFIGELKESLIPPGFFREKMNELKALEPDLASKYESLAGLYEAYQKVLGSKGLRDRADLLALYGDRKAQKTNAGRFKKIWMDGFFDFSELQLSCLKELSEAADEVVVTLTLDDQPSRRALFETVKRTEAVLLEMGFEKKEMKRLPAAHPAPALAALEEHLFSSPRKQLGTKPEKEIVIFEAVGIEGEVEMIARTIQHMARHKDLRFSDFAVLLRHIGEYEEVIRSVFSRYGIPVDVHERERLAFAPMLQVTLRMLRIFREDWKVADLMEFLKSSYVRTLGNEPKDYEWVCALEHEALAGGVFRGREKWLSLDREKKLAPLAALEDALRSAENFSGIREAMTAAIEKTFSIFQISYSREEYVRRDAASHKRFLSVLDEIERSFHGAPGRESGVSFEQFSDRFFRLVELDLYSVHYKDKNRVQVYNISLAREKEYEVVFVAGLLEKKFPVQIKEDPVLSDWERRLFNGSGTQALLKERLPSQNTERYLFYLAVTRARYKLILTYPRLNLEGKESLPSYYLEEVQSLFKETIPRRHQHPGRPYPLLEEAVNLRELEMAVMGGLWRPVQEERDAEPLLLCLTHHLLEDKSSRRRFQRAFYEVRDELTDEAIRELDVFRPFRTSATRLEEYAKCPFKYYAHYVLRLNDPEEDPNITARGTILHQVLEECFRAWMKEPAVMKDIEKAKRVALEKLREVLKQHPLLVEKQYQYDLEYEGLRETLERFLSYELERLKTSPLKPRYFEYDFGGRASGVPPLEIGGRDAKILIRGKIDRIDTDPDRKAGLVLDYKRTAAFSKAALELGTALQLPIYSMVLQSHLGLEPAGAELYSLKGLDKKGFYHASYLDLFPEVSKRRMILDDGQFRELLERSAGYIRRFTGEMAAMKIPVRPRECASFCPYSAVCRIEKWRLPLILEEIKQQDRRESEGGAQTAHGLKAKAGKGT